MNILKLASRNVSRNWQRTLVTTLAMAFAGFIMILFAALMAGMLKTSERNAINMDVGDIQIHAQNYRNDPDLYKRIDHSPPKLMGPSPAIEITPLKRMADMTEDTSTVLKKSARMNIDFGTTETENAVVKAVAEHIQNQNYQSASSVLR